MPKKVSRKSNTKKRSSHAPKLKYIRLLTVVLLCLLLVGVCVLVIEQHFFSRASAWITQSILPFKKQWPAHLAKNSNSSMKLRHHKPVMPSTVEEPIKFEFYSSLPTMKMGAIEHKAEIAVHSIRPVPQRGENFISYRDLAHGTSQHIVHDSYVVYVGEFKLLDGARNAQANLKAQGAMAQVISVKQDGRLYYQLRLGPYGTKLLASETLTAMQHRGFEGFYRKTN